MEKRCYGCMRIKQQIPICEHCGYNEHIDNLPHQLPVGTILRNQYLVGKVLGQGGFGITYIGWDQNLEIPVAIKEFFPNSIVNRDIIRSNNVRCTSEEMGTFFAHNRERFLREAKPMVRLQNIPAIARIYNFFQENDTAYIIMEFVSGMNLHQYLKLHGGRIEPQALLWLLRPVMNALGQVHEGGMVHRDISPDNIMVQPDGSAKVLDFGAVRDVGHASTNQPLAQSTEAILKHGFAPIEQYRRRGSLGPWTDVYALCATIYYCLTGELPNNATERIMGDDNVNWHRIPGLSPGQIAVLEKGMAVMPDQRIASVAELEMGLFGAPVRTVREEPGTGPVLTDPPPVTKKREKKGKSLGILAAVVAAVAALILFQPKDREPQRQSTPQTAPQIQSESQAESEPSLYHIQSAEDDPSAVTNMRSMFSECIHLTNLDLSNFETSAVTDYEGFMPQGTKINGEDWETLFQ